MPEILGGTISKFYWFLFKHYLKFFQYTIPFIICSGLKNLISVFTLTESIVYELLQLDTRFLPREANVNDNEYIGKMIVILNSIVKYDISVSESNLLSFFVSPSSDILLPRRNREIISMLPPYSKSHYIYMRDKWPGFLPFH